MAPILATGLAGVAVYGLLRRARRRESLNGKVVLVTGGSRGLGLVLARHAAEQGARVAECGRDVSTLDRARSTLDALGLRVLALPCDVTSPAAVQILIETVRGELGPVDVLINNAGVIQVGPVEEMTAADYAEAMAANFWGTVHATLAVLPEMRGRRSGHIVNIASIGGKISVPHLLPYSASKFAVVGFSRGLRSEMAPHGVTVVTVCPGLMRTGSPRNATFRGRQRSEYAWFSVAASMPLLSIDAETAAHRILEGAMRGEAEVVFPLSMRAAAMLDALMPSVTAAFLTAAARLLPGEARHATGRRSGKESESWVSPSWLTRLGDRAAQKYNQVATGES